MNSSRNDNNRSSASVRPSDSRDDPLPLPPSLVAVGLSAASLSELRSARVRSGARASRCSAGESKAARDRVDRPSDERERMDGEGEGRREGEGGPRGTDERGLADMRRRRATGARSPPRRWQKIPLGVRVFRERFLFQDIVVMTCGFSSTWTSLPCRRANV